MGTARIRYGMLVVAIVLIGRIGWAMEPQGKAPSTQPGAKADAAKVAAALRAAPAGYAAWKARSAAPQGKERVGATVPIHAKPLQSAQQASSPAPKAASQQIASALSALKTSRPDVDVRLDAKTGAAVWIKGPNLHAAQRVRSMSGAGDAAATAQAAAADGLDALHEYGGLLKITDASREFVHKESKTDSLGLTHVKYQQVYQGLPVWNKQMWVHFDEQGAAYLIEGRAAPTPGVAVQPRIPSQQAVDVAAADLGTVQDAAAELVVYMDGLDLAHLAWHVTATSKMEHWHVFVDAAYGVVLHRASDTRYEGVTSSGTDLLGRSDTFSSWQQGGEYYLIDTSESIHVADPLVPNQLGKGNLIVFDGKNQDPNSDLTAYFLTSSTPVGNWDTAGVNVTNSLRLITDYYKNHLGRAGLDGQSLNAISFVHVGTAWENAAWTGQVIFVGDGGQHFLSLARGLDVLAHEFTHGVVDYTANFEYQFQSGAMHEAFADTFAAMVDRANWTIGEDVVPAGSPPLRDLSNPANSLDTQATTMDDYQALPLSVDNGGVHINSTIVSHAAYLMAEGLPDAIGRDKVEQIFYRALTTHMTSQSDFADCRAATIQSAQELYPNSTAEVQAVTDAWDTVKVTASSGGSGGSGGQIPPTQGTDYLVFLTYDDNNTPRQAFTASDGNAYYVSPVAVSLTRAVVTQGGTAVLYVDASSNLRMASLSPYDNYDQAITTDGSVRTICGSTDGRYFAFTDPPVSGVYDNQLYVLDLNTQGNDQTFDLYLPSPDGGTTTSLLDHADVMDFDISNAHIIFDALSHFSVSGTQQDYTFWSVGILEIGTGRISNLVTAQPQGIQIGNPAASSTRDWILAVDVIDTTAGTCQTRVFNLQTNKSGLVAEQPGGTDSSNGWPSFNGDDTLFSCAVRWCDHSRAHLHRQRRDGPGRFRQSAGTRVQRLLPALLPFGAGGRQAADRAVGVVDRLRRGGCRRAGQCGPDRPEYGHVYSVRDGLLSVGYEPVPGRWRADGDSAGL